MNLLERLETQNKEICGLALFVLELSAMKCVYITDREGICPVDRKKVLLILEYF